LGKYFGHAGSVTLIYSDSPFLLTAGGDHKLKQWDFKSILNGFKISMIDDSSKK
jgi:hypothetical protein